MAGSLEQSVAAKVQGSKAPGPHYYIDKENSKGQAVRFGPFLDPQKAKQAHALQTQQWKSQGQTGKRPELIEQPAGWTGTLGVTQPSFRQSPRTGQTAKFATIPGVPSKALGPDIRRGA